MADGAFNNPLTGAAGSLTVNQVKSPNYVHGVSGWIIRKDGSAEFQSIIVPPGTSGSTIFVQGTTPTALHVNDLWVNTSAGNEVETWNGSAWVPQQWGTGAIQAGAITAALIAANTIVAGNIAAGTITSTQIAAATITGGNIAAGTITGSNIAATTITAANIAAATITATQIAAATIDATRLGPNAVTAANVAANQFGLNMVSDPQFTQSALNTIRATDAFSTGSWSFSANTAICAATTGGARLALMPSASPPMWVSPGEQYYVACTFTTTAANSSIFVTILTDGGTAQVSQSGVAAGTHTVSGVVTIPAGAHTGYFRFSVINASSNATTVSNPVCQPAALFSPTITGTNYIINTNGAFFYSGTPAASNLIASIASSSGTDAFGNPYYPGMQTYSYVASVLDGVAQMNAGGAYFGLGTPAQISAGQGSSTEPALWGLTSAGVGGEDTIIVSGSTGAGQNRASLEMITQGDASTNDGLLKLGGSSVIMLSAAGGSYTCHSARAHAAGGQTISSTGFTNITGMTLFLDKGSWLLRVRVHLTAAASAGQWQIEVTAPGGTTGISYGFKYESAAGVSGLNVNRTSFATALGGPATSVAGAYWATIEGTFNQGTAGSLVVKGLTTVGADTWDVHAGSYIEAFPI